MQRFKDRHDAGQQLAAKLARYRDRKDVAVLGLPRGGVPVAFEIAAQLHARLDIYIVRKLGTPGQEELAMGAIASDGAMVLNERVIQSLRIPRSVIEQTAAREKKEIERREAQYRPLSERASLKGNTVIVVDDGLATGASMKAAVQAIGASHPEKVVVAVATAPAQTLRELEELESVDEVVAGMTPVVFYGVGGSYVDFSQTTDEEVRDCLAKADQGRDREGA